MFETTETGCSVSYRANVLRADKNAKTGNVRFRLHQAGQQGRPRVLEFDAEAAISLAKCLRKLSK